MTNNMKQLEYFVDRRGISVPLGSPVLYAASRTARFHDCPDLEVRVTLPEYRVSEVVKVSLAPNTGFLYSGDTILVEMADGEVIRGDTENGLLRDTYALAKN